MTNSLLFLIFGAATTAILFKELKKPKPGKYPVQSKPALTPAEIDAYGRLLKATPGHLVLPQVNLSSFIELRPGAARHERNRFDKLSCDFLIATPNGAPHTIVEIDDRTHLRADRQKTDQKKNAICQAAGLRVIRWKATALPTPAQMRDELLQPTNTAQPVN